MLDALISLMTFAIIAQVREPKPEIVTRDQSAIVGETAFLHCRTQSAEQPQFVWRRRGARIGNSAKEVDAARGRRLDAPGFQYQYPNGTLRILDVAFDDAGVFSCEATTSGGSAHAEMSLAVHKPPTVVVQPRLLFVVEKRQFVLSCTASGQPPPEVSWYRAGARIVADNKYILPTSSE